MPWLILPTWPTVTWPKTTLHLFNTFPALWTWPLVTSGCSLHWNQTWKGSALSCERILWEKRWQSSRDVTSSGHTHCRGKCVKSQAEDTHTMKEIKQNVKCAQFFFLYFWSLNTFWMHFVFWYKWNEHHHACPFHAFPYKPEGRGRGQEALGLRIMLTIV